MRAVVRIAECTLMALGLAVAGAVAAPAARAQAPSFTGTWEMDAARSDFGQVPAPTKITLIVHQTGTTAMKVTTVATSAAGETTTTSDYAIDGKPASTLGADGQSQTNAARWDGSVFVVDTRMSRQGADLAMVSRWTMTPDGRGLTIARHLTTPAGDVDMTIVFARR